ncbi:MAG: hypothetical protein ABJB66_07260 [Gemmatimonadaceae bacterium]
MLSVIALCATSSFVATLHAQQVADKNYVASIGAFKWPANTGPRLVLDENHHNFHKLDGRYFAFGKMAQAVGFRVAPFRKEFTDASLKDVDVLVIANALDKSNDGMNGGNWKLPTPSAFSASAIAAVKRFVERGGGLLLVADHMPFAGAAQDLGKAIGVEFANGFAFDSYAANASSILVYRRDEGLVSPLELEPRVDSIVAFTGSAFRLIGDGLPLMQLPKTTRIWTPKTAWVFGDTVASIPGDGYLQGAALNLGKGRVVVLGEAAMLSAQRQGPKKLPMGMNEARAAQNAKFAASLLRWVSGEGAPVANNK